MEQSNEKENLVNENLVPWKKLEEVFGVTREKLEKAGELETFLNWGKTNLIPMSIQAGDSTIYTDGRLSLRSKGEGQELDIVFNGYRAKPSLDFPLMGHEFSDQDKKNLLETGNMGRIAELAGRNNKPFEAYVSLDRQTNELVFLPVEKITIPKTVLNVELTEPQKEALQKGEKVYVEGFESKNGKSFSAHLQVNADKRRVDFELPQSKYLLGVKLSDKQYEDLKNGKLTEVRGMKSAKGKEFDALVHVDPLSKQTKFFALNDKQSQDIKQAEKQEEVKQQKGRSMKH